MKPRHAVVNICVQQRGICAQIPNSVPVQFEFTICEQFENKLADAISAGVARRLQTGNPPDIHELRKIRKSALGSRGNEVPNRFSKKTI